MLMIAHPMATAHLEATAVHTVLGDGSRVYFLGIVDSTDSFLDAAVTTVGGGFFLYNIDDIVTAVPEAESGLLLGLGTCLIWRRAVAGIGPPSQVDIG